MLFCLYFPKYFFGANMKKEQLLDLYHQMVLIRRVEERGAELYQAGKIGGFMHLYIGQEAVSTGVIAARESRDRVITAYRDHGVALNCGISANEVVDLVKAWGLRVLWVCENNIYGMGTSVERASAVPEIRQKAEGYNMKNSRVDGMDVMKIYEATKEAIEYVRTNSQPYLLEAITYRYRGHSMGDPERYRKQEEVKKWQETDPIGIFRKYLIEKKTVTAKMLDEIEAKVDQEVNKAVEFAETSPEPSMEALFEGVYAEPVDK